MRSLRGLLALQLCRETARSDHELVDGAIQSNKLVSVVIYEFRAAFEQVLDDQARAKRVSAEPRFVTNDHRIEEFVLRGVQECDEPWSFWELSPRDRIIKVNVLTLQESTLRDDISLTFLGLDLLSRPSGVHPWTDAHKRRNAYSGVSWRPRRIMCAYAFGQGAMGKVVWRSFQSCRDRLSRPKTLRDGHFALRH